MRAGLGLLRLSPSAFYDLTLGELAKAVEGYNTEQEQRERAEWERTRWLACITLSPHAKKGKKIKPKDLATFPWEQVKPKNNGKINADRIERHAKFAAENHYLGDE